MTIDEYNEQQNTNIPVNEAYRILKANISFCKYGEEIKTVAITSCNPGEGKTTTAVNLGISLAKSGKKVLLIDADLRKLQKMKDISEKDSPGLSDFISGNARLDEVINSSCVENFYFIQCGSLLSNPTEMLESIKFSDFLSSVRKNYDMVIIDTPPLGCVIDCAIVSSRTDGTLLVVKSKAVSLSHVKQAVEQLEKADARILGAVLNRVVKNEYKNYYSYYDQDKNDLKQQLGKLFSRIKTFQLKTIHINK